MVQNHHGVSSNSIYLNMQQKMAAHTKKPQYNAGASYRAVFTLYMVYIVIIYILGDRRGGR